ncbi:hypothetical protein JCM11641_006574 [Rhodosporidiobolus odoratus]
MNTDSLKAAASIWQRLPNEEKLPASLSRGRLSPSSRSSDSAGSTVPQHHPHRLSLSTHSQLSAGSSPFLPNPHSQLDLAASPRSSISSVSFTHTPDSSTSPPRDRYTGSDALAPPSHPQPGKKLLPIATRLSPQLGASLRLRSESADRGVSYHSSRGQLLEKPQASGGTVPASEGFLSPPFQTSQPSPHPSPSAGESAQPLLAEIFSGNPRPHYRPPPAPRQPYTSSPHSDASALLSPPLQPERRSYFAAPPPNTPHGRARSQSSAPTFDKPPSPASPAPMFGREGFSTSPGLRASIAAPGAPPASTADEHGFRPSSTLPTGGMHFSASLPTTSAVGSPSHSSFRQLDPSPARAKPTPTTSYSPFGPSLTSSVSAASISFVIPSAADPQSGLRASTGLSHSFSAGWNDDPTSSLSASEREGRTRFRDTWNSVTPSSSAPGATLSSSAGSTGTGGIGMSNMSPFTRDGGRTLADLPGAGLGDGTWGSYGASQLASNSLYRARRDYSLGAVGTGRKRSDSAWGRGERLKDMDEDGEDDYHFAPPTKSGATSRRHSFAAFDPHPHGRRTQTTLGFHLPEEVRKQAMGPSSSSGGNGFGPLVDPTSTSNGYGSGLGSSAINDDDLAADFNSLHLNLEAHVAAGEPSRFSHVGSMPVDFPSARSNRQHDYRESSPHHSSAGPSATKTTLPPPIPSTGSTAQTTPKVFGHSTSPRATAEPFTPSMSTPAASRFFGPGPSAPLPPTTTTATASASTAGAGPRFDFGAPFARPPSQQSPYGRFGSGLPPPIPPPQTQHQYFTPATTSGPLSPRGGMPPPHPHTHHASPFAPYGAPSPSIPPPHVPHHQQLQTGYFAPPPPSQPSIPPLPPPLLGPPALTAQSQNDMNLGRGVPLHAIPANAPLCIVGFKAGRKDLFFVDDPNLQLQEGDLVIVEADRGRDVGKYLKACSVDEVHKFQQHLVELALGQLANPNNAAMAGGTGGGGQGGQGAAGPAQLARMTKECQPKRIYAKAGPSDTHALLAKAQDEIKALALVRSKVGQKGLPMEILDAEWQWDRRKLTFYYTADQRVDFRELVRELFRIWKTRVWLCCLDQQQPLFEVS